MEISAKIKDLRISKAMSQEDLALSSGLSPSTIGRIERGLSRPRPETLQLLAKGLGISPEDFSGEIPNRDSVIRITIDQENSEEVFHVIKEALTKKNPQIISDFSVEAFFNEDFTEKCLHSQPMPVAALRSTFCVECRAHCQWAKGFAFNILFMREGKWIGIPLYKPCIANVQEITRRGVTRVRLTKVLVDQNYWDTITTKEEQQGLFQLLHNNGRLYDQEGFVDKKYKVCLSICSGSRSGLFSYVKVEEDKDSVFPYSITAEFVPFSGESF